MVCSTTMGMWILSQRGCKDYCFRVMYWLNLKIEVEIVEFDGEWRWWWWWWLSSGVCVCVCHIWPRNPPRRFIFNCCCATLRRLLLHVLVSCMWGFLPFFGGWVKVAGPTFGGMFFDDEFMRRLLVWEEGNKYLGKSCPICPCFVYLSYEFPSKMVAKNCSSGICWKTLRWGGALGPGFSRDQQLLCGA